ncbi:uncharacterized protein LOC122044204 [Zingiber officinale]|uniref:uncharacterized protein LOC122044204 n=1 Tax=Zingiber officinale TaxID=94328 RepID=UPI001C4A8BF2|nr:uncharacterized protein LOC122044204 [Zingiber officinale]
MHYKYHHRLSRKSYIGLEAELREKKLIAENEEVDRSLLWRKAREDKSGNITNMEIAEVAEKIDDLLEKKMKGEFKPSGMNDVLTTALGNQEHYGRVRGVGGCVKPQLYFKTARKNRELVPKDLIDNFKEQSEENKSLKVEVERLKAQLAKVINNQTCEVVISNKSSNMNDPNWRDDVEVYECGTSNLEGKKCNLAVKQRENVVAYGTILSKGGPNILIHHVALGEGNFKVSIDVVLDEEAELPIPIRSGPTIVNDAVGTIVAWPKELVILPTKKKNMQHQSFAPSDVHGDQDKYKEIEKTLSMACKYIYSYVIRLMPKDESIHIEFDEAMFGRPKVYGC